MLGEWRGWRGKEFPLCARAVQAEPCTSPPPLLGFWNEFRSNGVALDVFEDGKKVGVVLYKERFVSALIQRSGAGSSSASMDVACMGIGEAMHKEPELAVVLWIQDEVPVVWHERVGEDAHAGFLRDLHEKTLEK